MPPAKRAALQGARFESGTFRQLPTSRIGVERSMADDFKIYGFEYLYDGRKYTFVVHAHSPEEAAAQAAARRYFQFVGELREEVTA